MSRSNVVPLLILAAALLLFLYTLSERAELARQRLRPDFSRLPSLPVCPAAAPDPHLPAFFRAQAAARKSDFEASLGRWNPDVVQVMLAITEEVFCPTLVRVGLVSDGGKWVCNPWAMPKGGVIFSLGSRDDISFEADFQAATGRPATIITVDKTAASADALAGLAEINARFVHAMIASKTNLAEKPPHYTVADLMAKQGHEHIEILKMDIEGAEHSVLPQFLSGNSVCQILVEIHGVAGIPKLLRAVANAGFLLQRYEINPYGIIRNNFVCEFSFIHESCLKKYGATLLASYLKQ